VVFPASPIFSANPFLRGLAIQFFAWSAIDAAIAFFGVRASEKRRVKVNGSEKTKEACWLSRILWINTGPDVFYILDGIGLLQIRGATDSLWRGHGLGIVIQGGFLFFFDFYHAISLRNIRTT